MRAASDAEIMPRWRSLADHEIRTKSSEWDLVTDADEGAERMLTQSLRTIVDVPVVGEEAAATDPSLTSKVATESACWLVDPVDGTRNFVNGSPDFACMVALISHGRPLGAWITYPSVDRVAWAWAGAGAHVDGALAVIPPPTERADARQLRGALGSQALHSAGNEVLERAGELGPAKEIRYCAGWDYLDIVTGATDYLSFSRTLPWDHAPGSLIAREAGLRSARPDGSEYLPGDGGSGIVTAHPLVWERAAQAVKEW
jgi:fructose-1,6-bisphosphatase/inositol monophosphatase family enzyme